MISVKRPRKLSSIRELPALILLLSVVGWLWFARPAFRNHDNLMVVSQEAAQLGIMACGEAMVILTGGIDLSIAATLALSGCAAGWSLKAGVPVTLSVSIGLLVGAGAGWLNGLLITWRRFPPLLATLGTFLLYRAIANVATSANPFNDLPSGFLILGKGWFPFFLFLAILALCSVLLNRTRYGRHLVAVGGSQQAARLTGVPVNGILRKVYLTAGLCAAISGLIMSAGNNNAQWTLADGWELDVIAAVVIGGVRLTGGEGSILGAGLGALIIVVLRSALFYSGVDTTQYGLITGAVILLAALAEQARRSQQRGAR